MEAALKRTPPSWESLKQELAERLELLQEDESKSFLMASKAIQVCKELILQLQISLVDYEFSPGEEVYVYKELKPFFLAELNFYNQLYELEMHRMIAGAEGLEGILKGRLEAISKLFERHQFIYRYMKSGATYFDDKLFFQPTNESAIAMVGVDFPSATGFPVCYDHVVAHLLAAEKMRNYIEKLIDDDRRTVGRIARLPHIVFTDSKAALTELGYILHSAGVFNNGKIELKEVMEFLQIAFHVDPWHYARTFQEILARKSGYTNAWDRYREKYLLRIQKIEGKYDR